MLEVIMSLEEGVACEELHQNAANAPNVASVRPAESKNDFRGTIMTCRDNRGVVLILEGCRTEVDKANLRVQEDFSLSSLTSD
jgi:hypothetical protein